MKISLYSNGGVVNGTNIVDTNSNSVQASCQEERFNPQSCHCGADSSSGETGAAAAAKSLQLCLALCDPTDGSPPGSPVPGILQARTLEWVAISFSNA